MRTFFMEKSYIVAAILCTKDKKFRKGFVTIEEANCISALVQKEFNRKNLNVCIIDNIDKDYFEIIDGVIIINSHKNLDLNSIQQRYQGYVPNLNILLTLWDDTFITASLDKLSVA